MGVHGGIQNTDFLGRNKLRNRIRFPDIQGMVVVIIIGGNKIIFSLPFADAGVGTMPCNRKFIMILMHPARHPVSARMGKIHLPGVPVHSFFHTGAIAVFSVRPDLLHILRRCRAYPLRHLICHIHRHQEFTPQPLCRFFPYGNNIAKPCPFRSFLAIRQDCHLRKHCASLQPLRLRRFHRLPGQLRQIVCKAAALCILPPQAIASLVRIIPAYRIFYVHSCIQVKQLFLMIPHQIL